MAAFLKTELGISAELVQSHGGVFEVTSEGGVVFSKRKLGRFPTHEEIKEKLMAQS